LVSGARELQLLRKVGDGPDADVLFCRYWLWQNHVGGHLLDDPIVQFCHHLRAAMM
jgi:hypothetical protein